MLIDDAYVVIDTRVPARYIIEIDNTSNIVLYRLTTVIVSTGTIPCTRVSGINTADIDMIGRQVSIDTVRLGLGKLFVLASSIFTPYPGIYTLYGGFVTLKGELVPKLVSELSDVRITITKHEILDIRLRRPGPFFTMGIVGNVSEQNGPQIPLLCTVLEYYSGKNTSLDLFIAIDQKSDAICIASNQAYKLDF